MNNNNNNNNKNNNGSSSSASYSYSCSNVIVDDEKVEKIPFASPAPPIIDKNVDIGQAIRENLKLEVKDGEILDELTLADRLISKLKMNNRHGKDDDNKHGPHDYVHDKNNIMKKLDIIDEKNYSLGVKLLKNKKFARAESSFMSAKTKIREFITEQKKRLDNIKSKLRECNKKLKVKTRESKSSASTISVKKDQKEKLENKKFECEDLVRFGKCMMAFIYGALGHCEFEKRNWKVAKNYYDQFISFPDLLEFVECDPTPEYKLKLGICEYELDNKTDARIYFDDVMTSSGPEAFENSKFRNYLMWYEAYTTNTTPAPTTLTIPSA